MSQVKGEWKKDNSSAQQVPNLSSSKARIPPSTVTKADDYQIIVKDILRILSQVKGEQPLSATGQPTSPTDLSTACTEFHLFPKLPAELRLRVWKYAVPGPRVIRPKVYVLKSHVAKENIGLEFKSSTPVPALLHTCKQSRAEASKTYQLGMRTFRNDPRIYVDFTRDTIYLRRVAEDQYFTLRDLMHDMSDHELQKLRYLAIQQSLWEIGGCANSKALLDLPNLKKLTLLVEREESVDSKVVPAEEPKDSNATFFEFLDADSDADSDFGCLWPDESENFLNYVLGDMAASHDCGIEIPEVEFKVLVSADR